MALRLADYVEQVDKVNTDVTVQALNAVLSSRRLKSDGLTLGVLAQEAMSLSNSFNDLVSDIVSHIDGIRDKASDLTGRFSFRVCAVDEQDQEEQFETADNNAQLQDVISGVSGLFEEFRASASTIVQNSGDLQYSVSETARRLDFLPELIAALDEYLDSLQRTAQSLAPWVPQDSTMNSYLAARQSERYTMESERNIHRQFYEVGVQSAGVDLFGEPVAENSGDDMGSNVELF